MTLTQSLACVCDASAPHVCGQYVPGQIRRADTHLARVQVGNGAGKWAEGDFQISTVLGEWLAKLPKPHKSMADSGAMYSLCQVRMASASTLRIQVKGPALNRDYGAAFTVPGSKVPTFILLHVPGGAIDKAKAEIAAHTVIMPKTEPGTPASPAVDYGGLQVGDKVKYVASTYEYKNFEKKMAGVVGTVVAIPSPNNVKVNWPGHSAAGEGGKYFGHFPYNLVKVEEPKS